MRLTFWDALLGRNRDVTESTPLPVEMRGGSGAKLTGTLSYPEEALVLEVTGYRGAAVRYLDPNFIWDNEGFIDLSYDGAVTYFVSAAKLDPSVSWVSPHSTQDWSPCVILGAGKP